MKGKPFLCAALALGCLAVMAVTVRLGEGVTPARTPVREIEVPLGSADRSALAEGDTLRKAHKYAEAIEAYRKVLDAATAGASVLAEAEYDIGLSYTWLGEYDKAETVFNRMLAAYKDDPNAVGYAQYCLAWIEVQKGKYKEAVARLERTMESEKITDRELAARMQFQVGKTHLSFLNDSKRANEAFQKVRTRYPDTRTALHPFVTSREGE